MQMKAAILHSADSVPVYGDFDEPVAGPDSEIVELVAAGIHQLTRSVATGRHYGRDAVFPAIPGLNAVARTGRRHAGVHLGRPTAVRHVRRAVRLPRRDAVPAAGRGGTRGHRRGHQPGHRLLAAAERTAGRGGPARHRAGPRRHRDVRLPGRAERPAARRHPGGRRRAEPAGPGPRGRGRRADRRADRRPGQRRRRAEPGPRRCRARPGARLRLGTGGRDRVPRAWPGAGSARTTRTSSTSRSARWPERRRPSHPSYCAAGS